MLIFSNLSPPNPENFAFVNSESLECIAELPLTAFLLPAFAFR